MNRWGKASPTSKRKNKSAKKILMMEENFTIKLFENTYIKFSWISG